MMHSTSLNLRAMGIKTILRGIGRRSSGKMLHVYNVAYLITMKRPGEIKLKTEGFDLSVICRYRPL